MLYGFGICGLVVSATVFKKGCKIIVRKVGNNLEFGNI